MHLKAVGRQVREGDRAELDQTERTATPAMLDTLARADAFALYVRAQVVCVQVVYVQVVEVVPTCLRLKLGA